MKHIPTFEQFITESYNRTQTKYKTQNVEWDDVAPGDYIADGPNVGEVSRVISNTKKGFTLKRVWNNVRKKDGEEFFVPHDLDAMKEHPKSIIKVINYVNESEVNETLAAASADKLSNRQPLTPKVNATLISNGRNGVLKMMREPDGKTHFWNPKTKEYVAKTITYNGKGEYLYSDAIDKDGNLKESIDEGKAPANDATIKLHINTYSSSEDPFDVATDIGKRYNWSDKEIEKAEAIIRKKYIN
jgi:hypothetical protein